MMRPALTVLAALSLALSAASLARPLPAAAGTPFTDASGHPFQADIDWAYDNGITTGCTATRFCPDAVVTREQMASFLVRMFHLASTSADFFVDDEGSVHESDINAVANSGVTTGCGGPNYCPGQVVTREQMASFIVRAAGFSNPGSNHFYDDDFRAHETDIDRLARAGVGTGCGSYVFCPAGSVTRGQMVAFLHRVVAPVAEPPAPAPCDRSYTPDLCIPSPPPQLVCADIPYRNFAVRPPDPHVFDGNANGIGCET